MNDPLGALVHYHPERYRRSRPFARQMASLYQSLAGRSTLPTSTTMEAVTSVLVHAYNAELDRVPFEQRPADARNLMKDSSLAMHYGMFCAHGRQIFDFRAEITKEFRLTDIDDVPAGALSFPYDAFYISFGRQGDLDLFRNGAFVDGAYVSFLPNGHLKVMLTTIGDDDGPWFRTPDNYYYLSLPLKDQAASISSIADKALEADLASLNRERGDQPPSLGVPGVTVVNKRPETVKLDIAALEGGYPVFRQALRLIINGLCYLTAYPQDVETRWPDGTPEPLLSKIEKATKPKEIQRTVSKLTSMGYTKVHFCGRAFAELPQVPTGRDIATHWRRGHWRNQPHGPRMESRKLVWIMPVLVRKDRDAAAPAGKIYLVD